MNKLTKVGCSALCGSLAAISSANAGDMTVTGGVDMSWVSLSGGASDTGNPIGIGSNLTFKGSGELDNGWTFGVTVANLNASAYSSTAVNIDMLGLGKLNINQGDSGNGIDAYDDKMPTAWEESWGAGLGTGIQLVSGVGPNMNIQYTTPTILGTTIAVAMAPQMGAADTADKGASGAQATNKGKGYDATVNINPSFGTEVLSGLNLFVGAHYTEIYNDGAVMDNDDRYEGVAGITLDIGPLSLGGGRSGILTGKNVATTDVDYYRNNMYGVAFNINDDLSISYGRHESEQNWVNPGSSTIYDAVTMDVTSYQIAYTLGGASLRVAENKVENAAYQTTDDYDKKSRTISVSLAF